MKKRLILFFSFLLVSFSFCQLLEETQRLLQLQGLQGQSVQQQGQQPQYDVSEQPSVLPSPLVQSVQPVQPVGPQTEQQLQIKEPPQQIQDTILPSDVLIVRLQGETYVVGVDRDGYAEVPKVGIRKIAGLLPAKVEEMILDVTGIKPEIQVITSPKLSSNMQTIMPQYVSLVGDFLRPGISPPGSLGFCIGNGMGLNQSATGRLTIYTRGKIMDVDFYKILKTEPEKLNLYIDPGSVIYAHKSSGSSILENVGNVFARLRDIALTIIAWIELDNYGRQRGWW